MQNRPQQTAWFSWILGMGVVLAALLVAGSWFDNMFYPMGGSATAANQAAFGDTKRLAMIIVGGSAIVGHLVTLLAAGMHQPPSESEAWSTRYREERRSHHIDC